MAAEFHLFLPQMRMTHDAIVERARAAEAAGFTGVAFMDHLAPPMADDQDMWEAMSIAGWGLAHQTPPLAGDARPRGGAHDDAHRGSSRAVRRRAASGDARPPGHVTRPRVSWSVRARHRLGLGTRGTGDLRRRNDGRAGTREPARGIAGHPAGTVDRGAAR